MLASVPCPRRNPMNNDKDCRVGQLTNALAPYDENLFLKLLPSMFFGNRSFNLASSNEVNLVGELNLRVHCAFGNVVETLCSCDNYQFCGVFDICYTLYIYFLNWYGLCVMGVWKIGFYVERSFRLSFAFSGVIVSQDDGISGSPLP